MKTAASEKINIIRSGPMTVKALIKILQMYNLNAEVRVVSNWENKETVPATLISEIDDRPKNRLGFTADIEEKKSKKRYKKVVIA